MGLMDEGETVVVSQWIASKKCGNRHHADRKKETWVIELTWYSSEHMAFINCGAESRWQLGVPGSSDRAAARQGSSERRPLPPAG